MKKSFRKILKKNVNLDKIFKQNGKKTKSTKNFIPLYPNYESNNDIYVKRLKEALKDERILNIGVTGPYGSGKSSILLGLIRELPKKDKCITVSLATFRDNRDNEDNENDKITDNNGDGKGDIKDLEIGILQQIIYKVDPKKIPLSKIVRIKEEREELFRAIITAIIYLLNSNILNETNMYFWNLLKSIPGIGWKFSSTFFLIILHIMMFVLIYKSLGVLLRKFNITSISFNGIDLISESKSESILNKYIDEIIYILKKSKYNIILFEDIDRFGEQEIFFKLRELNKIINDNDVISKNGKVRFIYAVRDDLLTSAEERTKFFDLIVPIIPIISNNNAQLKFIETLEKIGLGRLVSEDIIQEVSYFVNDMRLVINICNEFKVYYEKIYKKINSKDSRYSIDQLFAIIAYKNLEPSDFKNMQYDQGYINELIASKKYVYDLIKKDIQKLEDKNETKKNETENKINQIKKDILNTYDLRAHTINHGYFIEKQYYENSKLFIENADLEAIFKKGIRGDNEERSKKVDEIYSKNTWQKDYEKLLRLSNKEIEKNNSQIKYLKRRMTLNESLKEIFEKDNETFNRIYEEIDFEDKEKKNLLGRILKNTTLMKFIRNGYITEEYQYHINNIYLENMTIEEYNFIASVKLGKKQNYFTTKLPNIKIVNSRLNESDFENENILNFDLFKYLLNQKEENLKKNKRDSELERKIYLMVQYIEKNIKENGNFFFYCIDNFENSAYCLSQIIEYSSDLWGTILQLETKEEIDKYTDYLISNIQGNELETLMNSLKFKTIFENSEKINLSYIKKVLNICKTFEIRFHNISKFDKDVMDYIVNKNMYEINDINIKAILTNYSYSREENESKSEKGIFQKLIELHNTNIKNYIKTNINSFIENVLEVSNIVLSENEAIEIINCNPSTSNFKKVVEKVSDSSIVKITKIKNTKFWKELLKNNKIQLNIQNILSYSKKYKLSKELEEVLNDDTKFNLIFKDYEKYNNMNSLKNKGFEDFLRNIFYNTNISYEKTIQFIEYYTTYQKRRIYFDLEKVSISRMEYLVEKNIVNFDSKNYKVVKARLSDSLVDKYCKNNIDSFIEKYYSLEEATEIVKRLMKSDLRQKHKNKLLEL